MNAISDVRNRPLEDFANPKLLDDECRITDDIAREILPSFLDARELCSLSCVNKSWEVLLRKEFVSLSFILFCQRIPHLPPKEETESLSTYVIRLKKWLKNSEEVSHLPFLWVRKQGLLSLPKEIGHFTGLKRLNIAGCQLTSLPDSIGDLKEIESLYARNNQLTSLPESIGNLSKLLTLNVRGNQLRSVPDSIWKLTQLRSLELGFNPLTTIASSIENLSQLRILNVSGNQLTSLPDTIGNLPNLVWLEVNFNQLTTLPESIVGLKNLEQLDLSSNPRLKISDSMRKRLKILNIKIIENSSCCLL